MSMKYKLVQRKDFSKDASPDSKLYYAQIVNNGTVDLKELCENIAEESALSSADVRGVFDPSDPSVAHPPAKRQNGSYRRIRFVPSHRGEQRRGERRRF